MKDTHYVDCLRRTINADQFYGFMFTYAVEKHFFKKEFLLYIHLKFDDGKNKHREEMVFGFDNEDDMNKKRIDVTNVLNSLIDGKII